MEKSSRTKTALVTLAIGLALNIALGAAKLVTGATRGNGETGEKVTEQVMTVRSVPLTIPYDGEIEVQGEGIMRISALNKYNETAAVPLKNPRNAVAGAIRNLDVRETAKRNLDIIFLQCKLHGRRLQAYADPANRIF